MKKNLAVLLSCVLLAAGFAGCGSQTPPPATESTPAPVSSAAEPAPTPDDTANESTDHSGMMVGIIQMMEHPSLDTIRTSFMAEMEALGYGDVKIDHQNGQGDMSSLTTISQGFVGNDANVIVAIATPAAQAAAGTTTKIPIVFSAATDPVAAELLTDPAAPDSNITGVSDAIPVASIFQMAAQLTPDAKTFGFVYNLGEANSVSVIEDAKAYCDANGLKYLEATVTNTSEVQQAAQSLVSKVDAFFSPIDNTVASAMPTYVQVATAAGLPIYPGADSMVMDGGLGTVGIDYTFLGKETAKMTIAILEGTPVAELPVVTMENFRAIVNQETALALGIDITGLDNVDIYTGE